MDNFNIHKYLRSEYLTEGITDRVSKVKLSNLDFNTVNSIFGGNLGYGSDRDSVSFPLPSDAMRGVRSESDFKSWKEKTMDGYGDVEVELDPNASAWFDKVKINDKKFNDDKADYVQAKGRALAKDSEMGFSIDEDRKAKEYIKSIEDEDEREEERKRMFDNPEDLDEVELTQDFGELDEDHTKRENNQLKKIEKELKGSSKMHKKQAAIIKKIVKEIREFQQPKSFNPDTINLVREMLEAADIHYNELVEGDGEVSSFLDKRSGGTYFKFPHFNGGPGMFGKATVDRIERSKAAAKQAALKTYTQFKEYIEDYEISDASPTGVYGSVYLFVMFNESAEDYSAPKGGTQSSQFEAMDMNDPVLMRARAARAARDKKPEPSRGGLDFEDVMYLRDEQKDLEDRIAQLYRDMEQEAEPEGGEIADRYGSMLNKLEDKLYRVKKQINQYDMNESTRQDLGIGSSVSKRRAKAELKNPGNDGSKVYGLDKDGKRVHIKSINDVDKFKKFELDADLNERVVYDNETQLLKARIAADDFMRIYRSEFRRVFSNFGKEAEAEFKKIVKDKFSRLQEGSCGYTPDGKSRNKPASSDLIKLKEKLEQVNEKLCKKGEAYRKRRMAAGEKSSAYLSGRAVKVCKGQMSGKKKKK